MEKKLENLFISKSATVRQALECLCKNSKQVLFVIDEDRLVASLADGDIRRFLMKGGTLDAPVKDAAHWSPKFVFTTERRNVESIMRESDISAIPIVDDDMHVIDVVFRRESVDLGGICIRTLEPSDLNMVLEFFDQMAGDTRAMFNRGDVNRLRAIEHLKRTGEDNQIHFAATIRADDGSEIMVGYVFLWDIEKALPWLGIAVREDWKGHHLGRILLKHLDDWARPRGYGGLMLTSVPANIRAHSLYVRMGFEYFGVYPDSEFLFIKRYQKAGS